MGPGNVKKVTNSFRVCAQVRQSHPLVSGLIVEHTNPFVKGHHYLTASEVRRNVIFTDHKPVLSKYTRGRRLFNNLFVEKPAAISTREAKTHQVALLLDGLKTPGISICEVYTMLNILTA